MRRLLVLILAVAALVGVTAFTLPSNAGSVNGTQIRQQGLDADLAAIAGSPGFQCYLYADQLVTTGSAADIFPVHGAGVPSSTTNPASINGDFARYWLSQLLSERVVAQLVAARGLTVTPADLALGRVTLREQITGVLRNYQSESGSSCGTSAAAVLASLPAEFRNEQVQVQATQDALLAHESGYGLGNQSLNHYYVLHRAQFDTVCLSYVAFSSESDAAAARASIVAGTPFAQTGQVTPLGCAMRYALSSLPSSVTSLTKGKVSQPVAGGNGEYALFEITSTKHTAFVAARVDVENSVLNAGSARTSALIQAADRRAQVTADPRYGRVAPKTVALLPAKSPAPAFVLNPTVNLASSPKSQVTSGSGTAG